MLGRDDILRSLTTVTEVFDVPEWGGEVTIRPISLAEPTFTAFVEGPIRKVDGVDIPRPRLGDDASASEKAAARIAFDITRHAIAAGTAPGPEETGRRQIVGGVILGVLGPDGTPLFTWDDADRIRSDTNLWNGAVRVATRIFEMSVPVGTAEGKASSDPTPT